jgi:hypothetical protein
VIAVGADKHEKRRQRIEGPFVPMLNSTLDSPAWRAMSHGARSLFMALKRRYNPGYHNNGRIYLSQRKAAEELGSHHNEIARWFRELQHFGFIARMTPGYLGVEGHGRAPRWRLTELGYMRDLPTRDFRQWKDDPFVDKKTKSRAGKGARCVPGLAHTIVQDFQHELHEQRAGNGAHADGKDSAGIQHKSILPLPRPLVCTTADPGADLDIPPFLDRRKR